jgi:phosphatidylserine/phosphatidylglycerophosphate/cardiolipin synthase-like enzyme
MAKQNSNSTQGGRSFVGTILGVLLLGAAVLFSQYTGIDLVSMLTGGETTSIAPTQAGATNPTRVPATRVPATSSSASSATRPPSVGSPTRPPSVGSTAVAAAPTGVTTLPVGLGFGAQKGFWTLYFNAPSGSNVASTYVNGIDVPLAQAIDGVQRTLDIVAFEFNNVVLTEAVLNAHERGVQVRIVTDDEHGLEEEDESIPRFIEAGIPVVDDNRSALMHDKFMILDSQVVWTGSWNYTVNDTYRNNNNTIAFRSQRAVQAYQAEFDEMFLRGEFGPRSTEGVTEFTQDGVAIKILFAAEDPVIPEVVSQINSAQNNIRFLAFSFTQDDMGQAILAQAAAGVNVQGVFETTGSQTASAELRPMYCAGLNVRQDGNRYVLHHKVVIIDDHTVVTGSFNFSASATESNDENLLVIRDPDLAALYIQEFERRFAESRLPDPADMGC